MVPEKEALPARRFGFVRQLGEQTRVTELAEVRKIYCAWDKMKLLRTSGKS